MSEYFDKYGQETDPDPEVDRGEPRRDNGFRTAREKFLGLSLESTRKSYYPELKKQLTVARELAEKYRQLVEFAPAGIYEFDLETMKFTSVNNLMCSYTGYTRDEFMVLKPSDLFVDVSRETRGRFINELQKGNVKPVSREYRIKGKDGREFWGLVNSRVYSEEGVPKRVTSVVHDLTAIRQAEKEKQSLEAQLLQAQKMESIGTLAGGIAHDFNNILSSVIGFTELALDDVEKDSTAADSLKEVYSAGKRAKQLVKQILAFARQSGEETTPVQPRVIAEEIIHLLRSTIPTTIRINQQFASDAFIMGNPTQLHQIIMNLCTNAAHAMEDDGGELTISLKDIESDQVLTEGNGKLHHHEYVRLQVADTGSGIPPAIIDSIFEPYFTTKGPGEGTGMGLAMVQGIVESYGGQIRVESKPGTGTTFTLYLPVTSQNKTRSGYGPERLPTGTERILVVDDEAPLAHLSERMLGRLGYHVTTRVSSTDALELFRARPADFDLVITDMTMPDMTGDMLAVEMMKIRADIPVILCTGYSKRLSDVTTRHIGIRALVDKPIVRVDLARTVRKILDEDMTGAG